MNYKFASLLTFALFVIAFPAAAASNWRIDGGADGSALRMSLSFPESSLSYRFECLPEKVSITELGVTSLLDVRTGLKVSDSLGSTITPGASVMGLFTDQVAPNLIPASATPNPSKGWDLTIELSKNDPALKSLKTAKTMSLMTTGWTVAVELGSDDRQIIANFLNNCT